MAKEKPLIAEAVAAFTRTTGLWAGEVKNGKIRQDRPKIKVRVHDRLIVFTALVFNVPRIKALGMLKAEEERLSCPPLLIAPQVSPELAECCRDLKLAFMDAAGNAYMEAAGLYVYITGKRLPAGRRMNPKFRAHTYAGLRVLYALLTTPELARANYRDIARTAGVALGTIGNVLNDLERRGYLAQEKAGERRLLATKRLLEEWIHQYPVRLRPKLNPRRFACADPDWWRDANMEGVNAWWGGEVAAEKLTGHLKAAEVTLYLKGKADKFLLANRLRADLEGKIEILEAFWTPNEHTEFTFPGTVHPILVYADLMATTDARNLEAAKMIYERYLADALRA